MAPSPVLSYSSVRAYLECPLRWKYLYIDRIPEAPRGYFSFGRTIHSVLEELVRPLVVPFPRRPEDGAIQRTLDQYSAAAPAAALRPMDREALQSAYARLWVSEGYRSASEETQYRALGEDILLRYYDGLLKAPPRPVAVEEHLEARWEGMPIHGYIDRIDCAPSGGLEVLDYKTSRGLTQSDAVGSDQLSFYQVLVEKNYPAPVESLALFDLRGQAELKVPGRTDRELVPLQEKVVRVSDGIGTEAFEPTPGRQCARCEFRSMCPEFREVPAAERERLGVLVDRFHELRAEERRIDADLRRTAEELHRDSERLGVLRVAGSKGTVRRRRDVRRSFPAEVIQPILESEHLLEQVRVPDPTLIERLATDPNVSPAARRRIAEAGKRSAHWYWESEGDPE
ncbi:MAG: RecB family exonuclease [Thermoplasmata archaeon]